MAVRVSTTAAQWSQTPTVCEHPRLKSNSLIQKQIYESEWTALLINNCIWVWSSSGAGFTELMESLTAPLFSNSQPHRDHWARIQTPTWKHMLVFPLRPVILLRLCRTHGLRARQKLRIMTNRLYSASKCSSKVKLCTHTLTQREVVTLGCPLCPHTAYTTMQTLQSGKWS